MSMRLNLTDETFNSFKMDFDHLLEHTVTEMMHKNVETADISAKISISVVENENGTKSPVFSHKITSTLKIKDERTGFVGGPGYELRFNRVTGDWELVEAQGSQRSMFDAGDFDDEYDEEDEE